MRDVQRIDAAVVKHINSGVFTADIIKTFYRGHGLELLRGQGIAEE